MISGNADRSRPAQEPDTKRQYFFQEKRNGFFGKTGAAGMILPKNPSGAH